MTRLALALLGMSLLSVGLASPVSAGEHDDDEVRERRLDLRFILRPGHQNEAELNLFMHEGGQIQYDIRSTDDRRIYADLHYHPNGVEYIWQANETLQETSNFIAPHDDVFSFSLRRDAVGDVNILITLRGEFGIHSMANIDPIETAPAAPLLLVLTAIGLVAAWRRRKRERETAE